MDPCSLDPFLLQAISLAPTLAIHLLAQSYRLSITSTFPGPTFSGQGPQRQLAVTAQSLCPPSQYSSENTLQMPPLTRVLAYALPRRRDLNISMNGNNNDLPPVAAFSIQGILEAIQEDIEGDVDAIAEILGRSRFVLADQHDSHLPPQGIIHDTVRPLQAVEEASSSNERLAGDNIIILDEDASLVDGSNTGSAAYGLLERLQAMPRLHRQHSDLFLPPIISSLTIPSRTLSSPAALPEYEPEHTASFIAAAQRRRSTLASRSLLSTSFLPAPTPIVSEVYLSAGANGRTASDPPVVSESGRHYPLYSYDERELWEDPGGRLLGTGTVKPVQAQSQSRLSSLIGIGRWEGLAHWLVGSGAGEGERNAEGRLRDVLERQRSRQSPALPEEVVPDTEGDGMGVV